MEDPLTQKIKALQLRINTRKATLEHDKKVQSFIRLLLDYPEAWSVIYQWRLHPKPLVIVQPSEFDFFNLRNDLLEVVAGSHYLRIYMYSFFEQYGAFELDNNRIKRINNFLEKSREAGLLDSKDEFFLYCSQCHKAVLVNKMDGCECNCGTPYDFNFSLVSIPSVIMEEIVTGHLLELWSLQIARSIEGLRLIGIEIEDGHKRSVYTSIEYSDIGVGEKINGELDLLGLKDGVLVAFECKLNETTLDDIKDFLGVSENLFFKIRDCDPNLKLRKVIISYDGSKLNPLNNYFAMSIRKIGSTSELIKEIKNLFH